jgi:hypothetical protein
MNSWNAMTFEGRDNVLRVVRHEAKRFFELASPPDAWEQPTGCAKWQVRDIVGHLVDTTESYFVAFDAARNQRKADPAYGLTGMASRVDAQAKALRSVPQAELVDRAQAERDDERDRHPDHERPQRGRYPGARERGRAQLRAGRHQ